jgi:hypothetical protein
MCSGKVIYIWAQLGMVDWLAMHMMQADDLTKEKTSNPSK